ncbi:MAG TPA: hypothetical protein VJC03_00655, partial [bacterium]|nr:hypothetical protein [bacterium]
GIRQLDPVEKHENLILFRMDEWQTGPGIWEKIKKAKRKIVFTPWDEETGEALVLPLSQFYDMPPEYGTENDRLVITDKARGLLKRELHFLSRFFKVLGER